MLRLTLIGDTAADKLLPLIKQRFDYVETSVFRTIQDFCETSDMRSLTVDRLFILQDAFNGKPNIDLLSSFNDYLGKFYPSVRVISLLNDIEYLELFSSIFISPYMTHIKASNMKTRTIDDLVEQKAEYIRTKYGYVPTFINDNTLDEIIDDDDAEEGTEMQGQPTPVQDTKKTKGLFSIFGRGKKDKKEKKDKKGSKRNENLATTGDIPVYQPDFEPSDETGIPNFGLPENETDEEYISTEEQDDLSDMDGWAKTDEEEQEPEPEPDFDFTMFDGQVNVGNKDPEPEEEEEFTLLDKDEESPFNEDDLSFEEVAFVEPEPEEDEELDFNPFEEEPEYETGLDLEEDDKSQEPEEEQELITGPNIEEQREKFDNMKRDTFSKGVDTSFSDVDIPKLPQTDFDIEDVSGDFPVFTDLSDLEQQYNDKNIKVVEVERVVERVVEKPIHLGSGGVSKKVYPTGVRTLIFTGDRKSGLTRTALQTAMFYGKTERTLFVDFDIKRKGSLLFYGINNIIMEHDNVQNGLLNLKTTSMLKHVVYNYTKGGFDCLISLYGEEYENEDLVRTQRILSTQKDYKTVVIDCPLENLHLLEDILLYSDIIICMESDLQSTVNTVMGLGGAYSEESKLAVFLYNNAKYLLTMNPDPVKFRENLDYVSDLFSLEEEETDWSLTPILGTTRDLAKILNRM